LHGGITSGESKEIYEHVSGLDGASLKEREEKFRGTLKKRPGIAKNRRKRKTFKQLHSERGGGKKPMASN